MKKYLISLLFCALLLSGCYGLKEVDFATFKKKVKKQTEAPINPIYLIIKGMYQSEKFPVFRVNFLQDDDVYYSQIRNLNNAQKYAYSMLEILKTPEIFTYDQFENTKYYVGLGYKVIDDGTKIEWNFRGLLSKIDYKNSSGKTSISYYWSLQAN